MSSELAPPVTIQTSPEEAPSIPPWFAEVVLLARFFTQHDYLAAISEQVRLARGRAGTYEALDFVAVLLGYAASGEPTLEAFFERVQPFAQPFMALFGRNQLPARSTLARFLAAVDRPCLDALRRLFLHDRLQQGFTATRWVAFSMPRAGVSSSSILTAPAKLLDSALWPRRPTFRLCNGV